MELRITKKDLLLELQQESYYNELEIARLATQDSIPHKERVQQIISLVKENAKIIDAINLVDKLYFPNAQPQPHQPQDNQQPATDQQSQQ